MYRSLMCAIDSTLGLGLQLVWQCVLKYIVITSKECGLVHLKNHQHFDEIGTSSIDQKFSGFIMPHTKWVLVIKDIMISLTFDQIQNLHMAMESSGILFIYF